MGVGGSKHEMREFRDKVVIVTGGSRGIGLEFAKLAAAEGAKVAIIARDQGRIDAAVKDIIGFARDAAAKEPRAEGEDAPADPTVVGLSFDLSNAQAAFDAIHAAEDQLGGPVHLLVCSAGSSHPGYFEELEPQVFVDMMNVNYYSAVYTAQAAFKSMMKTQRGHICFVSSMAGQAGVFGFSAYTPSKFALRGLGEVLNFEGRPHNIDISMLFPPDTDTPGFAEENKIKPRECSEVSAAGGLFTPQDVAAACLKGIKKNKYTITVGTDGYFLGAVTAGFARGANPFNAFLAGVVRLAVPMYHSQNHAIAKRIREERLQAQEAEPQQAGPKKEN